VRVEIQISPRRINPGEALPAEFHSEAGARAEFTGVVRGEEEGRAIAALEYEAYLPMAENVLRGILEELGRRQPCLFVRVRHRVGPVRVGEAALHVLAVARHRGPALALVAEFMDRLKQDVPIWKRRALTVEELAKRDTA
jgi:molybdopterin synthase catalytic subunit